MSHNAIQIAEYLISKSKPEEGGELLTNMKLQKLLYYCQGLYYAKYKEKLFTDKIYAWQYGPVVSDVYHSFKCFGSSGIVLDEPLADIELSADRKGMLDEVFNYFNQFSAIKLMNMTHSELPWISTGIKDEITLEKLEDHFKKYLVNNE